MRQEKVAVLEDVLVEEDHRKGNRPIESDHQEDGGIRVLGLALEVTIRGQMNAIQFHIIISVHPTSPW